MGDAFSVPFILSWVDSLIMQMTKNGLSFTHCGVFANLADENSPIIFAFLTLVLFHQFELFCLRAYFTESKTTKDDKTICFNPFRGKKTTPKKFWLLRMHAKQKSCLITSG